MYTRLFEELSVVARRLRFFDSDDSAFDFMALVLLYSLGVVESGSIVWGDACHGFVGVPGNLFANFSNIYHCFAELVF